MAGARRRDRLARGLVRRPRLVLALWAAVLVAAIPLAMRQDDHLSSGDYLSPGSQSAFVDAELNRLYPRQGRTELAVLAWPRGGASSAAVRKAVEAAAAAVEGVPQVRLRAAARQRAFALARKGRPVLLPLWVGVSEDEAQDVAKEISRRLAAAPGAAGVDLRVLGEGALWAALDE